MSILIYLFKFSYWSTQVVSGEADKSALIKNPRQALPITDVVKGVVDDSNGHLVKFIYL